MKFGDDPCQFGVILGTSQGRDITLHNCLETSRKVVGAVSSQVYSSFYVETVFVGAHFASREGVKFKRMRIRYSYLDQWTEVSGIHIDPPRNDETEWVVKYKRPHRIEGPILSDYKVFIDFAAELPAFTRVQTTARIKQHSYIVIEATNGKPFEEYLKIADRMQNFLTLGVTKRVHILSLEGSEDGDPVPKMVEVYYRQSAFTREIDQLDAALMLFTLADVCKVSSLPAALKNWFEKGDKLEPVCGEYFATLGNPETYLEHEFLSVIRALEVYHRRFVRNNEIDESEHEKRKADILGAAPKEYGNWLEYRLRWSNEPSLPARLEEIFARYWSILEGSIKDKKSLIDRAVKTRNYMTHYDETLKSDAAQGAMLFQLTQALRLFVEMCLIEEMGFSRDQIDSLYSKQEIWPTSRLGALRYWASSGSFG
jgi:hypothetical protein